MSKRILSAVAVLAVIVGAFGAIQLGAHRASAATNVISTADITGDLIPVFKHEVRLKSTIGGGPDELLAGVSSLPTSFPAAKNPNLPIFNLQQEWNAGTFNGEPCDSSDYPCQGGFGSYKLLGYAFKTQHADTVQLRNSKGVTIGYVFSKPYLSTIPLYSYNKYYQYNDNTQILQYDAKWDHDGYTKVYSDSSKDSANRPVMMNQAVLGYILYGNGQKAATLPVNIAPLGSSNTNVAAGGACSNNDIPLGPNPQCGSKLTCSANICAANPTSQYASNDPVVITSASVDVRDIYEGIDVAPTIGTVTKGTKGSILNGASAKASDGRIWWQVMFDVSLLRSGVLQSTAGYVPADSLALVQNGTATVATPLFSVIGTPTISMFNSEAGRNGNLTTTYTAVFNVTVQAIGGDIVLGLPGSQSPAFPPSFVTVYQNGVPAPSDPRILAGVSSFVQPTNTTLSNNGTSFTVAQKTTVTIPVVYSFAVVNGASNANTYGVKLNGYQWSVPGAATTTRGTFTDNNGTVLTGPASAPSNPAAVSTPTSASTPVTTPAASTPSSFTSSQPSTQSVADQVPTGWLDSASCTSFDGWALDKDTQNTSISIHIYKDGPAGSGTIVGGYTANASRPDVDAALGVTGNHGYSVPVPASLKDGVFHWIYVYGINTNPNGSNPQLSGSPKSITCGTAAANQSTLPVVTFPTTTVITTPSSAVTPVPTTSATPVTTTGTAPVATMAVDHAPEGWLDSASCTSLDGWALDRDTQNTSISIHVYKNGPAGVGSFVGAYTASNSRPDVDSVLGVVGNHGYSIPMPASLKDGLSHSIYVYGINTSPSGSNTQLSGTPKTITCGTAAQTATPASTPVSTPKPATTAPVTAPVVTTPIPASTPAPVATPKPTTTAPVTAPVITAPVQAVPVSAPVLTPTRTTTPVPMSTPATMPVPAPMPVTAPISVPASTIPAPAAGTGSMPTPPSMQKTQTNMESMNVTSGASNVATGYLTIDALVRLFQSLR